jgi:DNA modification methylase
VWRAVRIRLTAPNGSVFSQNADCTILVRVGQESLIVSGTDLKVQPLEPTVLWVDRPARSAEHPTTKPVELIARMLRNSTKAGDIVLDLFGGSGCTLICCETLGRAARLCELDPRFVGVIVRRWQELTGQEAVLDRDGRSFANVEQKRACEGLM